MKTIIVSADSDASENNAKYGERYGYDWEYPKAESVDIELSEIIAKVHDAAEGRYDLTGDDLYEIQHLLCKLQ